MPDMQHSHRRGFLVFRGSPSPWCQSCFCCEVFFFFFGGGVGGTLSEQTGYFIDEKQVRRRRSLRTSDPKVSEVHLWSTPPLPPAPLTAPHPNPSTLRHQLHPWARLLHYSQMISHGKQLELIHYLWEVSSRVWTAWHQGAETNQGGLGGWVGGWGGRHLKNFE